MQGAAEAGDTAWVAGWSKAIGMLTTLIRAEARALADACEALANGPGRTGPVSGDDMAKSLKALQSKKGAQAMGKALQAQGVPQAALDHMLARIKAMTEADLPTLADPGDIFRGMAQQLRAI
jgi:hypothetical protein